MPAQTFGQWRGGETPEEQPTSGVQSFASWKQSRPVTQPPERSLLSKIFFPGKEKAQQAAKKTREPLAPVTSFAKREIPRLPERINQGFGAAVGGLGAAVNVGLMPLEYNVGLLRGKTKKQAWNDAFGTTKEIFQKGAAVGEAAIPGSVGFIGEALKTGEALKRGYIGVLTNNPREQRVLYDQVKKKLREVTTNATTPTGKPPPTDQELDVMLQSNAGKFAAAGAIAFDLYILGSTARAVKSAVFDKSYRYVGKKELTPAEEVLNPDGSATIKPVSQAPKGFSRKPLYDKAQWYSLDGYFNESAAGKGKPTNVLRVTPTDKGSLVFEYFRYQRPFSKVPTRGTLGEPVKQLTGNEVQESPILQQLLQKVNDRTAEQIVRRASSDVQGGLTPQAAKATAEGLSYSPTGKVLSNEFVAKSVFDAQKQIMSSDVRTAIPNQQTRINLARSLENIQAGTYQNIGELVQAINTTLPTSIPQDVRNLILRQTIGQTPMMLADQTIRPAVEGKIFAPGSVPSVPQTPPVRAPLAQTPVVPAAVEAPATTPVPSTTPTITPQAPASVTPPAAVRPSLTTAPVAETTTPATTLMQPRPAAVETPARPPLTPALQQPAPTAPVTTPATTHPVAKPVTPRQPLTSVKVPQGIETKSKEYFIVDQEGAFTPVVAKKIEVIPNVDTFIHRDPFNVSTWNISEGKSGMKIASGTNRTDVLQKASTTLHKLPFNDLSKAIQQSVDIHGISPRYTGFEERQQAVTKVVEKVDEGALTAKERKQLEKQGFTPETLAVVEKSATAKKAIQAAVKSPIAKSFSGVAYRVETGFRQERGATVADVIRYEQEELGNKLGVSSKELKEFGRYPAQSSVWVTRTKDAAKRYGEDVREIQIPDGSRIIATDGEGGILILKQEALPSLTKLGLTKSQQVMVRNLARQSSDANLFESRLQPDEAMRKIIAEEFGSVNGLYDQLRREMTPAVRAKLKGGAPIPRTTETITPREVSDLRGSLKRDLQEIGQVVKAPRGDIDRTIVQIDRLNPRTLRTVRRIRRLRRSLDRTDPSYRLKNKTIAYTDLVNRTIYLKREQFASALTHEILHPAFSHLDPTVKSSVIAEWKGLSLREKVGALGGVGVYRAYLADAKRSGLDPDEYMAEEYFAFQGERIFRGEKVAGKPSLLAALRRALQWILEKLQGLPKISQNLRNAYERVFTKLDDALVPTGRYEIARRFKLEGGLPPEAFETKLESVPITNIDIPPSNDLLSGELAIESSVYTDGFDPMRMASDIILQKNGERYTVVNGAPHLRGIQRRLAKGLSAPSAIEAVIRDRRSKNPEDYLHTDLQNFAQSDLPVEIQDTLDQMYREADRVAGEMEKNPDLADETAITMLKRGRFIKAFSHEILGKYFQSPHIRFKEIFPTVYVDGVFERDLAIDRDMETLDAIYKRYDIREGSDAEKLAERYRTSQLTKDDLAAGVPERIKEFSAALTAEWTDPHHKKAAQNDLLKGEQYVEGYVPGGLVKREFHDRFGRPRMNLTFDPSFTKSRKGEFVLNQSLSMKQKFRRYTQTFNDKLYLEPALKEGERLATELYKEGRPDLFDEAMDWMKYVKNPYATSGSAVRQAAFRTGRVLTSLVTQAIASGTLGIRTAFKNVGWGLGMSYSKYGHYAFTSLKQYNGAVGTRILNEEAPNLIEGALPQIYGTFGTSPEGIVKGATRLQRLTPSALAQKYGEMMLRQHAYLTGRAHGEAMGLTGKELRRHALMAVVETQQIYLPVDLPKAYRYALGRPLGQFVMPSIKQANEVLYDLSQKSYRRNARFLVGMLTIFGALSLLWPTKERLTRDGKPYRTGGISMFEGIDSFDVRRTILAKDYGIPTMAGIIAERFVSPLAKIALHGLSVRLPSDSIFNAYKTQGEIINKDLQAFIPQKASFQDVVNILEVTGLKTDDSTQLMNTTLGLQAIIDRAEEQGKPKEAEKVKQKYRTFYNLIGDAESADSELKSLSSTHSNEKKAIKDDDGLTDAEKKQLLKELEENYKNDRKTIIMEFNTRAQQEIKRGKKEDLVSFLGVSPAIASNIAPAIKNIPDTPSRDAVPTTSEVKKATASKSTKIATATKSIAQLEGYDKSGTLAQRHNNPGNLVYANQPGASKVSGSRFARFETPEAGFRALEKQISLDASRGLTVEQFINKYAPPSENDTIAYASYFSKQLGVTPRTPLKEAIQ